MLLDNDTIKKETLHHFKKIVILRYLKKISVTFRVPMFLVIMMWCISVYVLTNDWLLKCSKKCPQSTLVLF